MPVDHDLLLLITSSTLGEGEPDLGEKLLDAFLGQLFESKTLPAVIICLNSGIFLTTAGSSVLERLQRFEAAGTSVYSCGTCLEYHGRADQLQVGTVGNMRQTVQALLQHRRVLRI